MFLKVQSDRKVAQLNGTIFKLSMERFRRGAEGWSGEKDNGPFGSKDRREVQDMRNESWICSVVDYDSNSGSNGRLSKGGKYVKRASTWNQE